MRTLKRRISGWTRERGWPLTLTRPLPCCKKSQRVVQFNVYKTPMIAQHVVSYIIPKFNPGSSFRAQFLSDSFLSRYFETTYWDRESRGVHHTLQWATAVAIENEICQRTGSFTRISGRKKESLPVFFLPKHCTLGTEAMVDCRGGGSVLSREMEKESLEFPYTVICPSVRVSLSVRR